MAPDDSPPLSRRALRETGALDTLEAKDREPAENSGAGTAAVSDDVIEADAAPAAAADSPAPVTTTLEADGVPPTDAVTTEVAPAGPGADATSTATAAVPARAALTWVDASAVAQPLPAPDATADGPDLLGRPPRRSPFRPSVTVPTALVLLFAGAYAATTLMWPLHEVAPTVETIGVQPAAAAAAAPPWPGVGSAAISVTGIPGDLSSSLDARSIASITKVVTALVVLEEMPLDPGEQGPEFRFSSRDRAQYWGYLENGESAVDVPVGGALSQYQMLEAMLIGSGNNYADRLASNLWPTDAVFAAAANEWLRTHGVADVTVVEPTGLDDGNVATPAALLVLAQKALANPVIAEIVAKPSVDLPGVGTVTNTNGLLADPGVLGVKTGTLDSWNLLSAKNITVGETVIRTYASVLGQPDNDTRLAASRALYAQLEAELQPQVSVEAGTTVGRVTTAWGEDVEIVTATDAALILWNGGAPEASSEFSLDDSRDEGDTVGSLSLVAPLGRTTVDARLAADIEEPTAWWRLTHPLELFGLAD
ncbi:MAG: D-alanyl-D-alanine carboxypeptidase [Microbacterium sp.]